MAFEEHAHTAQTEYENAPQLKIQSGAEFIPVGDIYSMPPPIAFTTSLIEMTHLGTPKGQREFKGGRPEPVQLSVQLGYALGAAGIEAVLAKKGDVAEFRVEYSGSATVHTFEAVVMSFTPGDISVGGRWEGTLVLQISGEVTES